MASSRRDSIPQVNEAASDAVMAMDFLKAIVPPLISSTLQTLDTQLHKHSMSLSVIAALGHNGLDSLGISDVVERARIIAAIGQADHGKLCAPPPRGPNGEPVVVRPKIGFTSLSQIDTVNQTVHVRFFLDLYWHDPRVIGATYVPDGIWRPDNCYIGNQHGEMSVIEHGDRPVIADSRTGLLLWPQEFCGLLKNPMSLKAFPFDTDYIEVFVHQSEASSRLDYIFRPFGDPGEERQSVRFFFDVEADVSEWAFLGFNKDCYESIGGNTVEYTKCSVGLHVSRVWQYYFWKITLPMLTCTVFCFSALFFEPDNLTDRNATSATMFLATMALLYVIASTLPKTSYLTAMDKFVIVNLAIQFSIAAVSWVEGGAFGDVSPLMSAGVLNDWALFMLPVLLSGATLNFFSGFLLAPRGWPDTLLREEKGVAFHEFEVGVNVFPTFAPGQHNPTKLDCAMCESGALTSGAELTKEQLSHSQHLSELKELKMEPLPTLSRPADGGTATGDRARHSSALQNTNSPAVLSHIHSGRQMSALL